MTRLFHASSLPPPGRAAYLFDLDGTLIDIAPRPDLVTVPDTLRDHLRRLRALAGDALAIVSGRPLAELDHLLGDIPYATAAEHGAVLRPHPGAPPSRTDLPPPPQDWLNAAGTLAAAHPGAQLEAKAHGFVVHYRNAAPNAGDAIGQALAALIAATPTFRLVPAKAAWEVRSATTDKGTAVRALMAEPPFATRHPIYLGDDTTDEDAIAATNTLGGTGLRVDEAFGSPEGVRAWIAALADP